MKRRDYLVLFLAGLAVFTLASQWVDVPGYMDADYYYAIGLRLADGYGFSEPFLWNYLDAPRSLPHPAFSYWMPLPGLLAAAGMALRGVKDFAAARLPFLLLAACLPPLTGWLGFKLTQKRLTALLAGSMAILPGFYLPYLLTTESFGLYMLFGTLLIASIDSGPGSRLQRFPPAARYLMLGLLAGLMHLSRADGLLWLLAALGVAGADALRRIRRGERRLLAALDAAAGILVGYALVTGFWYARNVQQFGTLTAPGGSKTVWLTEYNQTFNYDPASLNPENWLASGWDAILKARFSALLDNLKTWVGVQGSVLLWPLALLGAWPLRRDWRVRFAALVWLGTLAFFTLIFPFAGARGGFFHSGAAFQPLIWCAAASGFGEVMDWGVRKRGWGEARSKRMFIPALIAVLAIFTGAQFSGRVIGPDTSRPVWRASWDAYQEIDAGLAELGAQPSQSVMVNNPPGYFAATGRAAVVIPADGQAAVAEAARQFGVSYLILDQNAPPRMLDRYDQPASSSDLLYLRPAGKAQLFKFVVPSEGIDCQ